MAKGNSRAGKSWYEAFARSGLSCGRKALAKREMGTSATDSGTCQWRQIWRTLMGWLPVVIMGRMLGNPRNCMKSRSLSSLRAGARRGGKRRQDLASGSPKASWVFNMFLPRID